MEDYLNFLFIGMSGHEEKQQRGSEKIRKEQRKEGRHEVKDPASSSDLKGDCIGMLRNKAQGDIYS